MDWQAIIDAVVYVALTFAGILAIVVPVLLTVAMMTIGDRKLIAAAQMRHGPNVTGPFGLLQPFADALKLLFKEIVLPAGASKVIFMIAPMLTTALALVAWAVMPVGKGWAVAEINVAVLYLFAVSSLGVYGIIMAGWASNSKYPFLGALRSAAQMVSYEVSLGLVIVTVILMTGSFNLVHIVEAQSGENGGWNVFNPLLFPMAVVFLISAMAETNRTPFDLPEGESELVAGYFLEYSSAGFVLFFLGEYANILLMSGMTATLFLGGYNAPFDIYLLADVLPSWLAPIEGTFWFALKTLFIVFIFIWVRATMPRYRYDQLMRLGWKVFLPMALVFVLLVSFVLVGNQEGWFGGALDWLGTMPPAGGVKE